MADHAMSVPVESDSLLVQQLWPLELLRTDCRTPMSALLADDYRQNSASWQ